MLLIFFKYIFFTDAHKKESNEDLIIELEEKDKKLRIAETILYRERSLKEREKVKLLREEEEQNILNKSYELWSSGPFTSDLSNIFNSIISSSKSPTPGQPSTPTL